MRPPTDTVPNYRQQDHCAFFYLVKCGLRRHLHKNLQLLNRMIITNRFYITVSLVKSFCKFKSNRSRANEKQRRNRLLVLSYQGIRTSYKVVFISIDQRTQIGVVPLKNYFLLFLCSPKMLPICNCLLFVLIFSLHDQIVTLFCFTTILISVSYLTNVIEIFIFMLPFSQCHFKRGNVDLKQFKLVFNHKS